MEALKYASRGGLKLEHALREFEVDVTDLTGADLGCSTGGFTDCLLQHGASHVYSVDTAYGELAWTLRNDDRVTVMERTNALHAEPPRSVDLVVIDLGWTPQAKVIPAARRWLEPGGSIITLVKPHYELDKATFKARSTSGVIPDDLAEATMRRVHDDLIARGVEIHGVTRSPIRGGKGKATGNLEWLFLVRVQADEA